MNKKIPNTEYGFGVEYEKFLLQGIAEEMIHALRIRSICEYPANDLMGNNSEVFEKLGCSVKKLKSFQFHTKYDLVWNFCEFERSDDTRRLVNEMFAFSKKYVFIVTQNNRNIGVLIHRLYHWLVGRKWNHGYIKSMSLINVLKAAQTHGKSIKKGFFDIPWFILDIYESGALLRKLVPKRLVNPKNLRESRFETLPDFIKSWLAHHSYVLYERRNSK